MFTSRASRSRTGVVNSKSAGSAAATPVAKSIHRRRDRAERHQADGEDRNPRAVADEREERDGRDPGQEPGAAALRRPGMPRRRPRSRAPGPNCRSVGRTSGFTSGGRKAVAAATAPATASRKRRSRSRTGRAQRRRSRRARCRGASGCPRAGRAPRRDGHSHATLVERLVVLHPRRVAGLLRVLARRSAEIGPLKVRSIAAVARAADLEHPRLVVQGVRRPSHRIPRGAGQTETHASAASTAATMPIATLLTPRVLASRKLGQPPSGQGSASTRLFRAGTRFRARDEPSPRTGRSWVVPEPMSSQNDPGMVVMRKLVRPYRRRAPELHEGRAGVGGARAAGKRRTAARPHRAALRPRDQRRLLRRAAAAEAASPARRRLRLATASRRRGRWSELERLFVELPARPRRRPRRRQLARSPPRSRRRSSSIPVCHLEAGLRSFDPTMPEEHNRRLTDHLSSLLLTHSEDANMNLRRRGHRPDEARIRREHDDRHAARERREGARARRRGASSGSRTAAYVLVTLHRPALVDDPGLMRRTLRGARGDRARDPGRLPGAPAHARAAERAGRARKPHPARAAAVVHELPLAADRRGRGRHRLGRRAGGDDGARASRASRCATTPSGR